MQQNYFQINGFAQRKPPLPVQSCFLQMLRDPVFFWRPNDTASSGRGEGGISLLRSLEKMPPKYAIFSTVLSKIVYKVIRVF